MNFRYRFALALSFHLWWTGFPCFADTPVQLDIGAGALRLLLAHGKDVSRTARSILPKIPEATVREEASPPPVLRRFGGITLGMKWSDQSSGLGNADESTEQEDERRLRWKRRDGGDLVVDLDGTGKVKRISSDSPEDRIPIELRAGDFFSSFEKVYGSRRIRHTEHLSEDLKMTLFPYSNLAVIVNKTNKVVEAIMVYDQASRLPR
jgi:hypothetical protein